MNALKAIACVIFAISVPIGVAEYKSHQPPQEQPVPMVSRAVNEDDPLVVPVVKTTEDGVAVQEYVLRNSAGW